MILALFAVTFLGLAPASADDGGTCANCHTQPKRQDAFSKQDEDALRAWLQAQDGQVAMAPQGPAAQTFPARLDSTPCIANCHAPNPGPKRDFSLLALQPAGGFSKMDEAALRAWMGYPSEPGNPATAAVSDGDAGNGQTPPAAADKKTPPPQPRKAVAAPQDKAAVRQAAPAPAKKADPPPAQQADPSLAPAADQQGATTGDTAAKPQLEATAADGQGRAHFDGADAEARPQPGDQSVDAAGDPAAKASPVGEVYLKPRQPSTEISDPPRPRASTKVDSDPKGPHDWNDAIGGGMVGVGGGMLIGLMMGGLPGALIGGLVGGALGGLVGFFF